MTNVASYTVYLITGLSQYIDLECTDPSGTQMALTRGEASGILSGPDTHLKTASRNGRTALTNSREDNTWWSCEANIIWMDAAWRKYAA
jgi:hypothetical protein